MLEVLCKRKRIRDFLKLYSHEKWAEVISNICEIAILNLKTSFHTLHFSTEDFVSQMENLKHPPKRKHLPHYEEEYYFNKHHEHEEDAHFKRHHHKHHHKEEQYHPYYMNDYNDNDYMYRSSYKGRSANKNYYYPNKKGKDTFIRNTNYKNIQSKIKDDVDRDKERYYNELRNRKEHEELGENGVDMRMSGSENYERSNEGKQFMFREDEHEKNINVVNSSENNERMGNEYNCTFGMMRSGEGESNQVPESGNHGENE